jgi:DNA adenine methylase
MIETITSSHQGRLPSNEIQDQIISNHAEESIFGKPLTPFLKWPGGKSAELEEISHQAPGAPINRFLDPFVGGGSVLLAVIPGIEAQVNDACMELINLYQGGKDHNQLLRNQLTNISDDWHGLSKFHHEIASVMEAFQGSQSLDFSELRNKFIKKLGRHKFRDDELHGHFIGNVTQDLEKKLSRTNLLQLRHGQKLNDEDLFASIDSSIRSTFYMAIRARYNFLRANGINSPVRDSYFLFLREFSYASMFRYNSRGEFNVPYGGISYNKKVFETKVNHLFSNELKPRLMNTEFHNKDFEQFVEDVSPTASDFVFIDPPYDSDFSAYDNREFTETDQARLEKILRALPSKVMVVIGDTSLIRSLYKETHWRIRLNDLNYKWTIKNRNSRQARHLTISNY